MYKLRQATPSELSICYQIVDDGRAFQKAQGFTQWTEAYPNIDTVTDDIKQGIGYVLLSDDRIIGYMCIDHRGEPAYDEIRGAWRFDLPYIVVHRLAFSADCHDHGLAQICFDLIDKHCLSSGFNYIRVDTYEENKRMQHILSKNGYVYCGIINFDGDKKAFDKLLS